MLATFAVQSRERIRGLVITLFAVLVLFVGMPGLRDALSPSTLVISLTGGVAVGVAALAARARRRDRYNALR